MNSDKFNFLSIVSFVGLILTGILLVLLAVYFETNKFFSSFLNEIGFTFFTSGMIALTFERYTTMRQKEEITEILQNATIKKVLRDKIGSESRYQAILSVIQDGSCQKTGLKLDLNIQDSSNDSVIRNKSLSYKLSHSCDQPIAYSITAYDKFTEETKEKTFVQKVRIGVLEQWQRRDDYSPPENATKEEIQKAIISTLANSHTLVLHRVHLDHFLEYNEFGEMTLDIPLQVPPNKQFKCLIQSCGITSLPGTYEFLNSAMSDALKITVSHPHNLTLKVKALHPNKELLEESFTESSNPSTITQSWYLPISVLPYWGASFKFGKCNSLKSSLDNSVTALVDHTEVKIPVVILEKEFNSFAN